MDKIALKYCYIYIYPNMCFQRAVVKILYD